MAEGIEHKLTTEQKVFLVKTFYETNNKSETCCRFFKRLNRQTTRETVGDILKWFEKSGTTAEKKRSGRPVVARTEENKAAVESVCSKDPTTSTRRAASMLDLSKTSILRILADLGLRPYRPRLAQQLNEDDPMGKQLIID